MDIMELRLEALKLARSAFGGTHASADLLVSEADKIMRFLGSGKAPPENAVELLPLSPNTKRKLVERLTKPGREYLKKKGA
jgi:hypothetical protein